MDIILPSADSRRVVVSYTQKYVHEVLVNRLVKLAQATSVVRWTDHPNMTKTVDLTWLDTEFIFLLLRVSQVLG